MLCEHTTEEQQLWSAIYKCLLDKINESSSMSDIELSEVDGQLKLKRKKPILREVVLSFSSPAPVMYIHFEKDNAAPGIRSLRVEGGHLVDPITNASLEVDQLVANVLSFRN
jgi:hypothetical protein